jgi:outer membrane protein assembly factor BamD
MNRPVPEADPVAYARMKYELENRQKISMMSHVLGMFKHSPETRAAAKSGTPAMAPNRPTIPLSVPAALSASTAGTTSDVSVQTVSDTTALDTKPDARQNPPAAGAGATAAAPSSGDGSAARSGDATSAPLPPPTNHTPPKKKSKKKTEAPPKATQPADTPSQPASTTPPADK